MFIKRLLPVWATLLLLTTSCIEITMTDGSIQIKHSGKDIAGGCEDLIHFRIWENGQLIYVTKDMRFDCTTHSYQTQIPTMSYGLFNIKLQAEDDSGNLNSDFKDYGFFYRTGYDSSFTAHITGDTLYLTRPPLPTNIEAISYALIAWTVNGVLGEFYEFSHIEEYVVKVPTATLPDIVHVTMMSYIEVLKYVLGTHGSETYIKRYNYPIPYKRIVQIRHSVWIGPMRRL